MRRARYVTHAVTTRFTQGARITAIIGLALAMACSHDGAGSRPVGVAAIDVTPASANLIVGDTTRLTASLADATGAAMSGPAVTWSSSKAGVATVSSTGLVSAISAGSATITASSGAASGQATVAVGARALTGVTIESGDAQHGTVATALSAPLVVRVLDATGAGVAGATVSWSAAAGSVSPSTATTNAQGRASVTWTLGTAAGAQTATASVTALAPAHFGATAIAGPVTSLAKAGGDAQAGPVGHALPAQLAAQATDAFGNGVSGATVAWTVSAGGGSLAATSVTDGSGIARATWTLGNGAPPNSATGALAGHSVAYVATATGGQDLGNRRLFPADNAWNQDISASPLDPSSAALIAGCGASSVLHPDFGTVYAGAPNGIPFTIVAGSQGRVPISFHYSSESDPGPYPVPPNAPIEGGASGSGDRHVLVVDWDNWKLYELFDAVPVNGGQSWTAGSGAIFDLNSDAVRPAGWTSADAAGLPILPGLVRYDEVMTYKAIKHALRFTCPSTRNKYIAPARHFASSNTGANLPPMGMRVRLKSSVDISHFSSAMQVILTALKTYGMFVADNGSPFFLGGAPDPRWSDDDLHNLTKLHGSDFEVVKMGPLAP